MAGRPKDLFEELRPALEAMGSTVAHCGESVGDGQSVKLVNQLLCGVHIAAAGEALAYDAALGLDPRSVHETIRHGAAASSYLAHRHRCHGYTGFGVDQGWYIRRHILAAAAVAHVER